MQVRAAIGPCVIVVATLGVPRPARADCVDGRPVDAGHRGTGNSTARNPYPENTIPSLLAAGEEGATMVEFDVQLSADGVPVLMHDPRVDGTTDGMGCVTEMTVAELQQLDAAAGTPMADTGIVVPTLAEVLASVPLELDVEIKGGGDGCPTFSDAEVAAAVLDELALDPSDRFTMVTSTELSILEEVVALDPDVYVGMVTITPATAMVAVEQGFDALALIDGAVDEASIAMVRDAGLDVLVWTVDEPDRVGTLMDWDVDVIISNEPPVVEAVRAERCDLGGDSTGDGGVDGTTGDEGGSTSGVEPGTSSSSAGSSDSGPTESEGDGDAGCSCRGGAGRSAAWAWWIVPLAWRRR